MLCNEPPVNDTASVTNSSLHSSDVKDDASTIRVSNVSISITMNNNNNNNNNNHDDDDKKGTKEERKKLRQYHEAQRQKHEAQLQALESSSSSENAAGNEDVSDRDWSTISTKTTITPGVTENRRVNFHSSGDVVTTDVTCLSGAAIALRHNRSSEAGAPEPVAPPAAVPPAVAPPPVASPVAENADDVQSDVPDTPAEMETPPKDGCCLIL